jgi:hypothetical protein
MGCASMLSRALANSKTRSAMRCQSNSAPPNRPYARKDKSQGRGTPPTRRDSRAASHGQALKNSTGRGISRQLKSTEHRG